MPRVNEVMASTSEHRLSAGERVIPTRRCKQRKRHSKLEWEGRVKEVCGEWRERFPWDTVRLRHPGVLAMWWRPLVFNFPVVKSAVRGAENFRLQPLRARVSAGGLRDTDYVAWFHTCRDAACARSRKRSKREPEMQARCVRAGTHLTEATRPLRPPPPLPARCVATSPAAQAPPLLQR